MTFNLPPPPVCATAYDINRRNKKTKLISAVLDGDVSKVEELIACYEKDGRLPEWINKPDKHFGTPLHYAPNKQIVDILLQNGADLNAVNNEGETPLHVCARRHGAGAGCVAALVDAGAKLDQQDIYGWTPLFAAAEDGDLDIMKVLLKKGAKVDERDKECNTALLFAADSTTDKLNVTKLLIKSGAKVNVANNNRDTPLTLAKKNGYDEMKKLLIDAGAVDYGNTRPPSDCATMPNDRGLTDCTISSETRDQCQQAIIGCAVLGTLVVLLVMVLVWMGRKLWGIKRGRLV